ncbi:uncharacterized protein N0V89_012484 [Didymosphaeria variabile]|uniref:Uncharacterized protein n=1 Tax=Didymosphaeria variabile TaxID=1932322 RepID=A0A9W8XAR3_9PLEO|nr:uncharacterized protein N0V89_012484 [Didymosphaeria variabile]KAJ4344740.1 hypothetical protein N0V89_012484 [Didymosphaeria variabile]
MGNAQSHGQPHNRLVKPKTNRNSPSIVPDNDLHVDSPVSLSSRYANLSAQDRQQIKSQLLSPVQTDFGYRNSFDGEDIWGDLDVQKRLSSRSNSLSCFGGKAGPTARLSSLPASKVSLVQSSQAVDIETAISILQEVQKSATPEDIAALQQALAPYAPSPSPRPTSAAEPGLSRRTSVVNRSTSSLTRRRSLLATPGLATRNSPVESNRRTWNSWRRPQLDAQEEAKWQRQDMVENSPLTRIAAMDLAEEGRESPIPRAQTPADMEYSHIGTLKLGSLRIANGEPSPAASAKLNWYTSQTTSQGEDYFSSDALDSPIMMKSTRKRRHIRSKSALQPPTPPLHRNLRVSDDARRAKTTSRYLTPPKPETPKHPRQQHHQQCQPLIPHNGEIDMEPEPLRRLRVMNKSQDTLATMLDSQPGIPDDLSEVPQHMAAADLDEGFASDEGESYREEAIRILDGTIFSEPVEASSAHEAVVPRANSTPKQQREVEARPPPQKADSGYSSGGSFEAKHREAWTPGTIPRVSKKPSMVTDLRQSENGPQKIAVASLYTFEQMLQGSTSEDSLPPAPTDEHMMPHTIHRYRSQEDIKETALPLDWHIDDLSLGVKAPKTPSTPTSFISHFSLDSRTSTQKRLQKRNPSFQELPVVQSCDPIPEGSIPSIPADVRKQFVRRLSEAPGMDCLTHTYPTKNHVNLDEPEAETELPALEPIKFPSPPATPEPESRGRDRKRPDTERSSSLRGLRRSLSLFRRKTKESKEEEQPPLPNEPMLLHIGTIAASLGRSPYDIALPTAHQKRTSSPTHPYQLGNAMPRAKSMLNMDAQTAAKLARLRSKDRASVRPGMPSRPKSYYSEREAMGDADIYRRHSFYGRAPPMPTIPSIGELAVTSRQHEQQTQTQTEPEVPEVPEIPQPTPANSGRKIRARSTGRGRVVSPLIEKYDKNGQRPNDVERQSRSRTMGNDVTYHAALQDSRAYSMGNDAVTRRHNKVNHPDWG